MKKILILLTIFKATLPNACTEMCQNENNAFLRDRCLAQAFQQNAISANDLASYLRRDINETDLNYNPSSIVSSLTGSNAASSNAYNFFLDPVWNMLMTNYGMGPSNGTYINALNFACPSVDYDDLGKGFCRNKTSGFYLTVVGWGERNMIPSPLAFQNSTNPFIQQPLALPPDIGDSAQDPYFQHQVGDPNCPTTDSITCIGSNQISFTHYKGCRICDQFLNNNMTIISNNQAHGFCELWFNNGTNYL